MTTIEQLRQDVQQYRAEEIQTVEALRNSIAPVWVAAYGSIEGRDANGIAFDTFIATVLDALPIASSKAN